MGGLTKALFGGSSQSSSSTSQGVSGNNAFGFLKDALSGNVGTGNSAMAQIANALGLGGEAGTAAANNSLDAFKDSSGYNFALDSGSRAITGNAASKGMLRSGATGKALMQFGQDLGQQTYNNWLNNMKDLSGLGLQSAGLISGAGGFSNQTSTSKGKGGSQGGIIPGLFG